MVIGFYILVQQAENNFIVPRVLGGAVKLHPLVIMGGVVIGASVAGIVGALLAAPVIASGKEIMSYLYAKILSQEPFPPPQAAPSGELISWQEQLQMRLSRWQRFIAQGPKRWQPAKNEPPSEVLQDGQALGNIGAGLVEKSVALDEYYFSSAPERQNRQQPDLVTEQPAGSTCRTRKSDTKYTF
jgi:hypothetical protein